MDQGPAPELASPDIREVWPSCRAVRVKPRYPYGTHHTKMMVLVYGDGRVRVVVHTANLVPGDWENRTQGLWVSPKCPTMTSSDSSKGTASEVIQTRDTFLLSFFRTGFKASLLRYLRYYEVSAVYQFITAVETAGMSGLTWPSCPLSPASTLSFHQSLTSDASPVDNRPKHFTLSSFLLKIYLISLA